MANGLETTKISELPEAITLNESDYSFIVQNGTSKKIKGLLLKGNAGDNGKSIEIQKTDTHIQWRQEGGQWINLVALADLKGDKGEQGGGSNVDLTDYATKVWVTQQLASYYTKAEIDLSLSNKADISHTHTEYASIDHVHNYNDLANKPTIPSKTSDLANDSGFLISIPSEYVTEEEMNTALSTKANTSDIPSLEGYATETFVTNKIAEASLSGGEVDLSGYATKDDLTSKVDKVEGKSLSTNDLTNELKSNYDEAYLHSQSTHVQSSDIPTKTSDLKNDSGFITSIPEEYITETELNAKGYLTSHQDISGLQPKTDNGLATTNKTVVGAINEIKTEIDNIEVSGSGGGLTIEQTNQLTTAYEHSQSAHVQASDIPSLEGYATETFVTNNYASKNHNHSEYASSSHRHNASEIDNLPSGGATAEQAAQIEANANAIGNENSGLIKEVNDMKSVIGDSNSGLVKDVTDLKANSDAGGSTPVALTEPYDDDIPRIFLSEGILPTTKTSTTMKFEYISKNKRYSGYVDIKCQGTSSMAYAKKNFTIKTFNDKALTTKMKINFMNWGNQNKFCLKANFIDISHARNIVSARLWGDIVETRENYSELPELLRTSPNNGAVDGFFVKVYANGVYQGRYTMNIPKDGWMANMNKSLDEHCILSGENYQSGLFRATAQINGTDWSDELHDIVPTSIVTRWNQVINFVMNSSDSEFKANIGQYFDLTSLIDYYIFAYVSCGLDSMGKNQIYMTYDGQKWFASMYDMDSTWGLYWNGQRFVSASYRMQDDYESGANGNAKNLLYLRLEQTFVDEIKERYAVLRNGALSETNIINKFEEFMICNSDLIKEDYEIFSGIPSQNTNNIKQIRQYVVDRCKYVDEQIDNLIIPVPCTGITLDKTSLTFTDNTPQTLQVTVEPTNTTDKISYSINPTDIAKIADGTVTPLKNGTATITVTCGTISKTCSVDITGIEEGSVTDDYTALDLSSIQKGQPFTLYDGALDLNEQTVFADITLDDSSVNQNIISIGQAIESWSGSGLRLHCYYPKPSTNSTRTLEMVLVNNLELRDNVTITNNKLRMALNANGIYANGTKAVIISEHVSFTSFIAQKTAQIGSLEGRRRSNATYNEIRIYNRALSGEELITLTSIDA